MPKTSDDNTAGTPQAGASGTRSLMLIAEDVEPHGTVAVVVDLSLVVVDD